MGYSALVDNIIGEFLSMKPGEPYLIANGRRDFFEQCVDDFTDKLRPEVDDDFEHQTFIDALVKELTIKEAGAFHLTRMDSLFSPLLQALYNLERNDFDLDLSHLPVRPYRMMTYLSGTEDNVLRLSYNGKVWRFGEYLSHCSLDAKGHVQYLVGHKTQDSEFILHVPPENIGDSGLNNRFRLSGIDELSLPYIQYYKYPPRIALVLKRGDCITEALVEKHFFKNGNQLHIPEGPGGWKEVLPG